MATRQQTGVHLWLVLMKAFHAILAHTTATLADTGLCDSDFRVLEALLHKGPLPVNTVGPKVHLTPGSISVAVDRLHAKGLVSRVESPDDRRVRVVALTAKGRALITRIFREHADVIERVAEVLSEKERAQLTDGLRKIGKYAATLPRTGSQAG
jgi:MarR family 2-MHQ and catechol resistance regulon transcriptional repressor